MKTATRTGEPRVVLIATHQTDRFIYSGPSQVSQEVMLYAERKASEVPVLRLNEYNEQGKKADQADGDQANTILQGLQT